MGKDTRIAWATDTFNPWWGCKKITPECMACYAYALANQHGYANTWDQGGREGERRFLSDGYWKQPILWNNEASKKHQQRRVFCGSMCDWLDPLPELRPVRDRLFNLIAGTPFLTWLLLSKRNENWPYMIPTRWLDSFPANVWFGMTAGCQDTLNNGWEHLEVIKSITRRIAFVSMEPLLEEIEVRAWWAPSEVGTPGNERLTQFPDWLILGGESEQPGFKPRLFPLDGARSIIAQVRELQLPTKIFVKQLGTAWAREVGVYEEDPKGDNPEFWPEDLRIQEFPDKCNYRELHPVEQGGAV